MEWFSFGKKDEATANTATDGSGVASSQVAAARDEAERALQATPRRRGRPSTSANAGGGNQPTVSPALANEIARQLEGCYDPGAWAALLALPADAAFSLTGREYWELSSEEKKTLGATGSAAARTLMITNPRSLAFMMLGAGLLSVYGTRAVKELKHQALKKKGAPSVGQTLNNSGAADGSKK